MSRMSDAWLEVEELVYDAIAAGCEYDNEVVYYVNERAPLKVDRDVIISILDRHVNDNIWYDNTIPIL